MGMFWTDSPFFSLPKVAQPFAKEEMTASVSTDHSLFFGQYPK